MGYFALNDDLSKYVNSLLFDDIEVPIASYSTDKYIIELTIIGCKQIWDNKFENSYRLAKEYPDSLVQDIKSGRVYNDERWYVDDSNEFAYAVYKKKENGCEFLDYEMLGQSNFTPSTCNISEFNPYQLESEMKYIINEYYEDI